MLTQEERDARTAVVDDELDRLGRFDKLTDAQTATRTKLLTERQTLSRETAESYLAVRRAAVLEAARAGQIEAGTETGRPGTARSSKFTGDPWAEPDLRAGIRPGVLRGQAVSAIERCDALTDASRQKATADVEADDDPQARLARLTVALSQPSYRAAYVAWMRDPQTGPQEWSPEEREAVRRVNTVSRSLALGGSGGLLVPFELDPAVILAGAGVTDPMRRVSRVVTSAVNVKKFVTSAGVTASWDAESAEVSDDTPTLVQPSVTCYTARAFVPVSFELLEDEPDLTTQVGVLFADAKATLESAAFTVGSGVGEPKGVVTAVKAVPGSVVDTSTNALGATDAVLNQAALPARWRPRARFMANLSVINGFRVIAKSASLTESLVDDSGPQPRMAGWLVEENSAMDGTLGAGVADYALLSGDFSQYAIVDRLGARTELVPHLFGAAHRPTGERGFLLHFRSGADALVPDAFRVSNYSA